MTVHDLRAELARRQRSLSHLQRKRDTLLTKLRELDKQIASAGGHLGGARRRPRNEKNLVDALHEVLTGKTMSVTDVSEEVQRKGYMTTSPSFRTIVNQTLINHPDRFKRIDRGQYTAK
jgi:vacuolar-type H+-ATPase subunit D/Vma8